MSENVAVVDSEKLDDLRSIISQKNEVFDDNQWIARFSLMEAPPYFRVALNTQPHSRYNKRIVDIMSSDIDFLIGVVCGAYETFQNMKNYYRK